MRIKSASVSNLTPTVNSESGLVSVISGCFHRRACCGDIQRDVDVGHQERLFAAVPEFGSQRGLHFSTIREALTGNFLNSTALGRQNAYHKGERKFRRFTAMWRITPSDLTLQEILIMAEMNILGSRLRNPLRPDPTAPPRRSRTLLWQR